MLTPDDEDTMKNTPSKTRRIAPRRKKKPSNGSATVSDLFRSYGLPEPMVKSGKWALRYKQPLEKGIAWYWFSMFIRKRDELNWHACISCGKPKKANEMDAGHFAPASNCGNDLLMDETNVNGECGKCNAWDDGHLIRYEINLDKRHGEGTAAALKDRYLNQKRVERTPEEWGKLALHYKQKYESLSKV